MTGELIPKLGLKTFMVLEFVWFLNASCIGGGSSSAGDEIISPQSSSASKCGPFAGDSAACRMARCFPSLGTLSAGLVRWVEAKLEVAEGPFDARRFLDDDSLIAFRAEDEL